MLQDKKDCVADALSRPTVSAIDGGIDYVALPECQSNDPDIQTYRTAITGLVLRYETKYNDVVATLDQDTAIRIILLLLSLPT